MIPGNPTLAPGVLLSDLDPAERDEDAELERMERYADENERE